MAGDEEKARLTTGRFDSEDSLTVTRLIGTERWADVDDGSAPSDDRLGVPLTASPVLERDACLGYQA